MANNLLDSISGVFNNDMIKKAASALQESEGGISKAVTAGIPSLLSGIISTAGFDGGSNLLNLSKQAAASNVLDNPSEMFGAPHSSDLLSKGGNLLSGLFGSKSGGLSSIISNYAGLKSSTSHSLLSAIAPIVLAFLGKHALGNNMNGSGLLSWLTGQKAEINSAIPSGVNLTNLFDGAPHKVAEPIRTTHVETTKKKSMLMPILLAVLGIGLLWYLMKGCNKHEETTTVTEVPATTAPPVTETVAPTPPARESMKVKLADGTEIDAYKGGIEDQLVIFLNDASRKPGDDVWFDFDNLTFESGSARITAESQVQVNNIAAILKAYPKAKIKIGGYTDVTGDAAANKKLSQDRADAVVAAVKAAGGNAKQLVGSEGYGSQFAKAAADAPDSEKEKDRRIAVGVREK